MSGQLNKQLQTEAIIWNLADLYAGADDPQLDEDIHACAKEAADLRNSYEGRIANLQAEELLRLVERFEKLEVQLGKVATFAFLNFAARTKDSKAAALLQKIREANSRIGKDTVFFELEWNKVDEDKAQALLCSETLTHYRHYLINMRRNAPHLLSHIEETLLLERSPVGRGSWTNLFDKVMGHLKFGKNERAEEEVLSDLYKEDREVRKAAAEDLTGGLKSQLHVLTHIFNTILADKMVDDRLRKYDSWVSSMNLYNELQDETVNVLVQAVTDRYDIPQRYYTFKKKILGLPELLDYDRYAPLPHLPSRAIPWEKSREIVLKAFDDFSSKMAYTASLFFDRKWIHAPVLEGKRGGAFAHPCVPDVHPYVMVNYTGTLRDISTLAHELGHGVHQYLAAEKGYYNSHTTLVLAETASVFGELILFNAQLDMIDDENERKAFTCQKLESIFATVFRQISMNRFENEIHNARREQGELASETLTDLWMQTQRPMFGDSVTLTDNYGIWWSYIPHFLSTPGYVYSYAFGELLVLALYNIYRKEGDSFVPKYLELLSRGGTESPYVLLEPFGIDLNDPTFWQGGLQIIDEMLTSVEQ